MSVRVSDFEASNGDYKKPEEAPKSESAEKGRP